MKNLFAFWLLLSSALLAASVQARPVREEAVFIFENRKVVVAVPPGFAFGSTKDEHGLMRVELIGPKENVTVQLVFVPDVEGRFADGYERKQFLHASFNDFVASSTEGGMQFDELEPKSGVGTYCVFTDANLVGKTKYPPGEFLHATKGVKAWPGVLTVFSVFSNDTTSKDYLAVMKMLRESVAEKAVPLR